MRTIIRVPIERTCKMCGTVYESTAPRSVYCSDACRQEYATAYAARWRDKHREQYRKYQRDYQKKLYWEIHGEEIQKQQS